MPHFLIKSSRHACLYSSILHSVIVDCRISWFDPKYRHACRIETFLNLKFKIISVIFETKKI